MTLSRSRLPRGLTLVELLVVVAGLGLLASIAFASVSTTRATARDAYRMTALHELKTALKDYRAANNGYPSTGSVWYGMSVLGGSRTTSGTGAYIPGLAPAYIDTLPADPSGVTDGWSGFLYMSDGSNYKLLSHYSGPESFPQSGEEFYDPVRPTWAWMVCSGEPACSRW